MPDIRHALRSLSKQPGFCISAILTLALGIGANTAMFSVFDAVILHPLPYRDSSRLVLVWQTLPDHAQNPVSGLSFIEWSKQARSFDPLLGIRTAFFNFRRGAESQQLLGAQVSRGFFSALGLAPILGREFRPGDEPLDHDRAAILSYGLWQRAFASDPHVLGQHVNLQGESFEVVGVAAPGFDESLALHGIDVWTPLSFSDGVNLRSNNMAAIGRLRPGVTLQQANRDMQVVAARLEAEYPELYRGWSAGVQQLQDYGTGRLRATIAALLVGVGMVLLIACVNVANLLLVRADTRQKEAAIRTALGAGRTRLVRQLLTETMLLAFAGSIAGAFLAWAGLRLLVVIRTVQLPGLEHAGLNTSVLGFTAIASVFTGLLFALLPSRQLLGGDLNRTLRESGRGAVNPRGGRGSRNILVISEIALSLILLAGAGMMARSLLFLQNENRGFVSDHLLTFRASFLRSDFPDASAMGNYYQSLLSHLAALPGVRGIASSTNLPLDGFVLVGEYFGVPGYVPPSSRLPAATCNLINPGYLRALGIPLVRGREFDDRDGLTSAPVAMISSALARLYFPGQDPIGRKIAVATPGKGDVEVAREIVGVVGDVRYLTRSSGQSIEIYLPYTQTTWPNLYVMLRTTGDPNALAPQVRVLLRDPGSNRQSIADMLTMQERIAALNDKPRLNSLLAVLFASVALLLAAVGIYGVVSYSTLQRAQEIGVRMALGATPRDIVRWILGQAALLTAVGLAAGLLGSLALSRALAGLLYGPNAAGSLPLLIAILVLGSVALLASYIPARRAVRGDPLAALRTE